MAAPKNDAKTVELWLTSSDWDQMRIEKLFPGEIGVSETI